MLECPGSHAESLTKQPPGLDQDLALVAGLIHHVGRILVLIKICEYEELAKKPGFLDQLLSKLHPKIRSSILKIW